MRYPIKQLRPDRQNHGHFCNKQIYQLISNFDFNQKILIELFTGDYSKYSPRQKKVPSFYFSTKCIVNTHWKCLIEIFPMNTHNICF